MTTPVHEDGPARQGAGFDPTPYIRQLRGRGGGDYLDVKWRLLWLRKEHPDAEIVTELVQHDPQMAIFKATVTIPTGGKATGGKKAISLEDEFYVEGKLDKPSAFYVLRRSSTDYDWARLDATMTPLVLESVWDPLF